MYMYMYVGLLWWLSGKELACQCRRWIQSLSWDNPLEKEMAIHFRILAWEILWKEKPGRLQSMELKKSQTGLSKQTIYMNPFAVHLKLTQHCEPTILHLFF